MPQLYTRGRSRPKYGVNSEFAHFVNENDKVMTENFAERFVDHRNVGLRPKRVSELTFHHRKRGFNVAALVIVRQKFLLAEVEIVVHFSPLSSSLSLVV